MDFRKMIHFTSYMYRCTIYISFHCCNKNAIPALLGPKGDNGGSQPLLGRGQPNWPPSFSFLCLPPFVSFSLSSERQKLWRGESMRAKKAIEAFLSSPLLSSPHSPSHPSLPLPLFRPCCVFGSYYWPSWMSLPIFVKTGTYGSWSAICHTEYFLAVSPICIIAGSGIKVAHY